MFKRIIKLKDLLWAAAIGLAVLALVIGLVSASFIAYHGDRGYPAISLRKEKPADAAEQTAAPVKNRTGLQADGTLHPLSETNDAGQSYLDSLALVCDSSCSSLRGAAVTEAAVWSSETGSLPMSATANWLIRYSDGSSINPSSAALTAKPPVLVLAVGSDGVMDLGKDQFVENYESLISSIAAVSPKTRIVCLSLCSVTASYAGSDLSKDRVAEINGWIKTVCIDTGAYYGDLSGALQQDGYLRDEFADGSGRALNSAGLRELLNYLRTHSLNEQ